MDIRNYLFLCIHFMYCSSLFVQPHDKKSSMVFVILRNHTHTNSNKVIQSIWQKEPSTSCNIEKPPDASLSDKTFVEFDFIPYLCVILYDTSLRYMALNLPLPDNIQTTGDIPNKIIQNFKPESFCQKMKANSWSTNIKENQPWVTHFNNRMRDKLSCERYCVTKFVNPLCAYALWLDSSVKNFEHLSKPTQSSIVDQHSLQGHQVQVQQSPVQSHRSTVTVKDPPKASVENLPDSQSTKHSIDTLPVRLPDTARAGEPGTSIVEKNSGPRIVVAGTGDVRSPANNHENPELTINYQPGIPDITGTLHIESKQHALNTVDLERENPLQSPHQDFVEPPTQQIPKPQAPPNSVAKQLGETTVERRTSNFGIVLEHNPPASTSSQPGGTNLTIQAGISDNKAGSAGQLEGKITEDVEQPVTSNTLRDPSAVAHKEDDKDHAKPTEIKQTPLNVASREDQENSLPAEHVLGLDAEETKTPSTESVSPPIPNLEAKQEHASTSGKEAGKEKSPLSPKLPDKLTTETGDENGELDGAISGQPNNHEQQKAIEEGALGSRGEEDPVSGHVVAPQSDDDVFGDQQDLVTEEPRFVGESDDSAVKLSASPKFPAYDVQPEEDDDDEEHVPVNEEQEKSQINADTGLYVHDRFVDAEDSHFFAYFMTMIVLCIIGYLIFHNKQKILALALEGRVRKGSRRRPSTSGYRKLDSNLEEAVTSNCAGPSVTHVIY